MISPVMAELIYSMHQSFLSPAKKELAEFTGNGDFRSDECLALLNKPDRRKRCQICKKGFCPKQGKSLKNYAIFRFNCKPRGTISSARKHVFEKKCCKSVAKTVTRKVPNPETRINTGLFWTSKPRGTTPTPKCKTDFNCFCLGVLT